MRYFMVELASQKYFLHFPTNSNRKGVFILRGDGLPHRILYKYIVSRSRISI